MTTIQSRISARTSSGNPHVWGTTPESYRTQFIPSLGGGDGWGGACLLKPGTDLARAATDINYFEEQSTYAGLGYVTGRHIDAPEAATIGECNTDGAWGSWGKHCAFRAHSLIPIWLSALEQHEIIPPAPHHDRKGGWPGWLGPVRQELKFIEDRLRTCRNYDDGCFDAIIEGLACCAAYYESVNDKGQVARCIAIAERAMKAALSDFERNNGLGLLHDPRTGQIMAERDHCPPCVSTDATASYAWACCVMHMLTLSPIWKTATTEAIELLKCMCNRNGTFPPFVMWSDYDGDWRPVGYNADFEIVSAYRAIWPKGWGSTEYVQGIPPTENPAKKLARINEYLRTI